MNYEVRSGNLCLVMELEAMYSGLLKSGNIHHNNHSTIFADLLVKNVPGLNKKTANKCVSVFLTLLQLGLTRHRKPTLIA